MKNIHKIFSLGFVAALTAFTFTSCEDEDKARFPELTNGGFVKFVETPELNAGLAPETAAFSALTEDPNGNVATYALAVAGTWPQMVDGELELVTTDTIAYKTGTEFPFEVGFTGADMASLFGVPVESFGSFSSSGGDTPNRFTSFEFFATVTTDGGVVYDWFGSSCDCPEIAQSELEEPDGNTGVWNGSNTDGGPLSTAAGLLSAMNYEVAFEDPDED